MGKEEEMIGTNRGNEAESQRIVAQRPLSRVQYLLPNLSRIQRICLLRYLNLIQLGLPGRVDRKGPSQCYDLGRLAAPIRTHDNTWRSAYNRFPAWILA